MPEEGQGEVVVDRGEVSPEQMEEITSGEFLTVGEVADKLRYSYQWVLWMLQEGRIKGIKPLGSRWRIPQSEFDRILKEGLPPMPREEKEKPPVTEIAVEDKKIIDKVKEPEKKKEPPLVFPWSLLGGGKQ